MVSLRPRVGAPGRGVLPGFLHLGDNRPRGHKAKPFPHGIKDMAADVAGPAGPEILPRAPFGLVINFRRIGSHRSGARPQVPVQSRGRLLTDSRTRAFKAVGLDRSRPIRAEIGVSDLTDPAFPQPLDAGPIVNGRSDLGPELGVDAVLDGRLGQGAHFGDVVTQGFLAIDVFASRNGAVYQCMSSRAKRGIPVFAGSDDTGGAGRNQGPSLRS